MILSLEHLPACILGKSNISENNVADITTKTIWVPAVVHSLDDTSNDELPCTYFTQSKYKTFLHQTLHRGDVMVNILVSTGISIPKCGTYNLQC